MKSLLQFDHRKILNQIPRPLQGTCSWITQDPEFQRWQNSSSNGLDFSEPCHVFYIHGSPGVGKTVMSRYVLTYLRQTLKMNNQKTQIFVYFFCDDKDLNRRTSLNLLRSLLFQILIADEQLLRYVGENAMNIHLENLHDNSIQSEELNDLWDALLTIIQRSRATQFWFIVDAVDELEPTSRKDVIHHMNRILESDSVGRLKILFTDRQTPRYQFSNQATLELGATESRDDVRTYIRQGIVELGNEVPIEPRLRVAIEDEIAHMANGTFLHATLAFANFKQGVTDWTPRIIKSRFNELQKLPASLEAYYVGLLRHIRPDFQRKARRAFIWVLGSISRDPLKLKELHYAVSINHYQRSWSDLEEDLGYNFESSLQEACGYLLKTDEDGFVVFSHQTVKELFESASVSAREVDEEVLKYYRITPKDIDQEIVQSLTTVLQFRDFDRNHVENSLMSTKALYPDSLKGLTDSILKQIERFPLLIYAIIFWAHFNEVTNELHVVQRFQSFFESFQGNYFRLAAAPWTRHLRRVPTGPIYLPLELPALHHCVQMGDFPKTVLALMARGANVNELDSDGMSPLHWACARGNKATIEALLSNPELDPNAGLPGKNRPLHVALEWLESPLTRSRSMATIEIPLLLINDRRTDVNAAGVRCKGLIFSSNNANLSRSSHLRLLYTSACATVVDTQPFQTFCLTTRTLI